MGRSRDSVRLPLVERRSGALSGFTTFRVGGRADSLVFPATLQELQEVIAAAERDHVPWLPLGRGSNLLVSDSGYRGIVIVLGNNFASVQMDGERVTGQAGVSLPLLARRTAEAGLAGLEFAAGIPGSLGGAIRMNAGTRDGEIAPLVREVVAVGRDGTVRRYRPDAIGFAYRKSRFQTSGEVVAEATLALRSDEPAAIQARIQEGLAYRVRTQPLAVPSAGSVFRNPPGDSAGRLLEAAGCKGMRFGGAEVSRLHANWVVNTGGATARDIWELIRRMRRMAAEAHGVRLELELEVVGEGFADLD